MSGLMKIYNYIEQTFFFTLTRKIVGNLSFVFLFQAITLFWLYDSLSEQQNLGLFWPVPKILACSKNLDPVTFFWPFLIKNCTFFIKNKQFQMVLKKTFMKNYENGSGYPDVFQNSLNF